MVGDPASTFLVFGALVEADVVAPKTGSLRRRSRRSSPIRTEDLVAVVRGIQGCINADECSEQLKINVAVRVLWVSNPNRARWACCSRRDVFLGSNDILRHDVRAVMDLQESPVR